MDNTKLADLYAVIGALATERDIELNNRNQECKKRDHKRRYLKNQGIASLAQLGREPSVIYEHPSFGCYLKIAIHLIYIALFRKKRHNFVVIL